jgi:hypothetical protein
MIKIPRFGSLIQNAGTTTKSPRTILDELFKSSAAFPLFFPCLTLRILQNNILLFSFSAILDPIGVISAYNLQSSSLLLVWASSIHTCLSLKIRSLQQIFSNIADDQRRCILCHMFSCSAKSGQALLLRNLV